MMCEVMAESVSIQQCRCCSTNNVSGFQKNVPVLFLTLAMGLLSSLASRTDTERAAVVLRRGTGRGGPQALPALDVLRITLSESFRGGPRQRARTARVNVRASARTNGERGRQLLTLGHSAGRQIHPRAERRRKAASEALVQLERPRSQKLNHRSCAVDFRTAAGCSPG